MAPITIELKSKKDLKRLDELEIEYTLRPLEGFIYVPSIKLHVAEEESPLRKNWHETNEAFAEEDSRIPTILEFVIFLNHIEKENLQLYKKIIQSREENPWRLEWLDAYFKRRKDGLYVLTENKANFEKTEEGLYVLNRKKKNAEKLENALMEERESGISFERWLKYSNLQGLPRSDIKEPESNKDKLIYWPPKNGRVAGFEVSSDGINLDCDLDPSVMDTGPVFMARAVKDMELKSEKNLESVIK